jgi:hypothetical protein
MSLALQSAGRTLDVMALGTLRTRATAVFVVVTLLTGSMAFAQESSKSEESSRETKEEIRSILSDIEKRQPSGAPAPIQPLEVRTVSAGRRVEWRPFVPLGIALVLGGVGFIVFKVWAVNPRARRRARRRRGVRRVS